MQENRRIEEQSRLRADAKSGVPARGRDGGMEKIRRQGPQKSFSDSEEPEKLFCFRLRSPLTLDCLHAREANRNRQAGNFYCGCGSGGKISIAAHRKYAIIAEAPALDRAFVL